VIDRRGLRVIVAAVQDHAEPQRIERGARGIAAERGDHLADRVVVAALEIELLAQRADPGKPLVVRQLVRHLANLVGRTILGHHRTPSPSRMSRAYTMECPT